MGPLGGHTHTNAHTGAGREIEKTGSQGPHKDVARTQPRRDHRTSRPCGRKWNVDELLNQQH